MICLQARFHMPSSNGSLFIATKAGNKSKLNTPTMLFYILRRSITIHHFSTLRLSGIISIPFTSQVRAYAILLLLTASSSCIFFLPVKCYARWPSTVSHFPPISSLDVRLIFFLLADNVIFVSGFLYSFCSRVPFPLIILNIISH
jgi:hypothetical protein